MLCIHKRLLICHVVYLQQRLTAVGISAEIVSFSEPAAGGTTTFHNVVGTIPGDLNRILILGSHFDTKAGIDNFVGANDSGSSSGLQI